MSRNARCVLISVCELKKNDFPTINGHARTFAFWGLKENDFPTINGHARTFGFAVAVNN